MSEPRGVIKGYVPKNMPGVECDLYLSDNGAKIATVISDNKGRYWFEKLASGTYELRFFGGGMGEGDWLYNIPVIGNVETDIDKIPPVDFGTNSEAIGLEPGEITITTDVYNIVGEGTYFERYSVGGNIKIVGSRYNDGTYTILEISENELIKVNYIFNSPESKLSFYYEG